MLSPGSRNAPLLISFSRHPGIEKIIIPDERAAGFVALGIAQQTRSPVVLTCTSGTALLNYAPAIAEAFYREIPLIVLSADRPPELIDQRDGQTIRQFGALSNHVKSSVQLPIISDHQDRKQYQDAIIENLKLAQILPQGPVHLNIPFKEPFYPSDEQSDLAFEDFPIRKDAPLSENSIDGISISESSKIMVLLGQLDPDPELNGIVRDLAEKIPVLRFPINNISSGIDHVDGFIKDQKALQPDILITAGLSVLSKNLKTFLRNRKPSIHYHFDAGGVEVDTYGSSPQLLKVSALPFLKELVASKPSPEYLEAWEKQSHKTSDAIKTFFKQNQYSEASAAHYIIGGLQKGIALHLSNSMPVRYADLFGVPKGIDVFANRGTSGIDGCTATAVGASLVSNRLNVLLTGDLAFLYDRNAFFHNHQLPNLRVVVLNNKGGGIFRLIKGPSAQPELEDYFETRHNRTAEYICKENDLEYYPTHDFDELKTAWSGFFLPSKQGKVLEIFTDPEVNQTEYKKLRNYIDEQTAGN